MQKKILSGLCILLAVFVLLASIAYAQETEKHYIADAQEDIKYRVADGEDSSRNKDLPEFKSKLNEEGFYRQGVGEDTLSSGELDGPTMTAVRLVTEYNDDLIYYEDGVSLALYWRVMDQQGTLKSPAREKSDILNIGSQGDDVTEVQNRLSQLGYGNKGEDFTKGVYDEKMQDAVDAFVQCNNRVEEREDGITKALYECIMSDSAVTYTATKTDKSVDQRVMGYFGGTTALLGLELPVWLIWALGFVLLCVIVFLLIRLLGGKGEKKEDNPTDGTDAQDAIRPGKGEVVFRIEYNGMRVFHKARMKDVIFIGRSQGSFPLNPEDLSVSRKQCELIPDNGKLRLRNRSSHGTVINGERLQSTGNAQVDDRFVHNGDVIEFGAHKVTVFYQE